MSQSAIGNLITSVEGFFSTLVTGIGNILTSAVNEVVNYAPTLVDIGIIGAVAVGLGYALRSFVKEIPFVSSLLSGLGRLFRI